MTHVLRRVIASTICIPAAMFAAQALAQTSSGNSGSGETPRALSGSHELPAAATAAPLRTFDPEEAGRAVTLDPDRVRQSHGIVSRSRGGEVNHLPPSDDVLRLLDGADLETPADSRERKVFLEDGRQRVPDSSRYPFRTVGLLYSEMPSGEYYACTATLIAPRTVLTAAQCLYTHEDGGWHDDFQFVPGINGDTADNGIYEYETAYLFEGFLRNYTDNYGSVMSWDIAVVVLNQAIGDDLGWLGYAYEDDPSDFYANIVAYHQDKPAYTQWHSDCDVPASHLRENWLAHRCPIGIWASGAGLYTYFPGSGERYIYAVQVAENEDWNFAVRINRTFFTWIQGLAE